MIDQAFELEEMSDAARGVGVLIDSSISGSMPAKPM